MFIIAGSLTQKANVQFSSRIPHQSKIKDF